MFLHSMHTPLKPNAGSWNTLPTPHPHVTVAGILYDKSFRFPVLFRSDKVRSAKNRYSLPTGLHECGLTMAEQMCVEAKEEFNLTADPKDFKMLNAWDNILTEESWHWTLVLGMLKVRSLDELVNNEPDKHSRIEFISMRDYNQWLKVQPMDPSMHKGVSDAWSLMQSHIILS